MLTLFTGFRYNFSADDGFLYLGNGVVSTIDLSRECFNFLDLLYSHQNNVTPATVTTAMVMLLILGSMMMGNEVRQLPDRNKN